MNTISHISIVIIAKNAAATLDKCLSSCSNFSEIVLVLDKDTTDDSLVICKKYQNVKVSAAPFLGFGKMKQYVTSLASNDWVLSLDSDEVLSKACINEIGLLDLNDNTIYAINRHNFYKDKHVDACGWNNDYPKRIFNRNKTNFSDNEIHESVLQKELNLINLKGPILHYAYQNENQLADKAERYGRLYAKENYRAKHSSLLKATYKSAFTFFKDLFLRKGFLYGSLGFMISKYNALGAYLKYKYLAEENKKLNHTLIVSTYNRPDALALVLKSIAEQSIQVDQVIIADDGSTAATKNLITSFETKIKNLQHVWQEDEGFRLAAIRNKALKASTGDFISMIDGDMVLHPDFIKTINKLAFKNQYLQGKRVLLNNETTASFLKSDISKISFFSEGITNRFNTISNLFLSKYLTRKYNSIQAVKGCSMHFWKSDAEKINGFNESFVGWGREDSEFLSRLLNAGITRKNIIFGAVAYHLYHEEASRAMLPENDKILDDCINEKKAWCNNGLNKKINQ